MKALLLCQNLGIGGAEELILHMSVRLRAEGVDPVVVAITRRGPIGDEIAAAGVPVILAEGQPGPRDLRAFVNLARLVRQQRPDVVHTFLLNACLYGRMAAIAAGAPVILAAEQNLYPSKRRRHARLERLLATRTHRVVACCKAVAQHYCRQVGVAPPKVAVVYNAIQFGQEPEWSMRSEARRRLGVPSDAYVVGTLGRLTVQKGHSVLLQAMSRLNNGDRRVFALVAGDGPLRAGLESRAADLGLGEQVRFLGIRRDRETMYGAMDAFVLPSRWEGLSLALVEAMGAARPVVATNVGGNPEVVEHGSTGLLVPPGDPSALADAIDSFIKEPRAADRMRRAAAEDVRRRFAIDKHVREIAGLYRDGLSERAASRLAGVGASG